mgnify:CR=1 FL=1
MSEHGEQAEGHETEEADSGVEHGEGGQQQDDWPSRHGKLGGVSNGSHHTDGKTQDGAEQLQGTGHGSQVATVSGDLGDER